MRKLGDWHATFPAKRDAEAFNVLPEFVACPPAVNPLWSIHLRIFGLGVNHTVILCVDLERTGRHVDVNVIFVCSVRWHSPRVPASEASAIFEGALLDHFAFLIGNGELGRRRTVVVDNHIRAYLTGRADQRHLQ
jgi:hypothetical protein